MNKTILVLDENSVIHGLISSALDMEGLNLHHEFNPENFIERASSVMPDLILVGKSDQDPEMSICRQLKENLEQVPLVLMTGSKDSLSSEELKQMRVAGVVRKPFEASDLQQQVGRYIDISDLVGSAYEFRQTQITGEEASNPLANLNVVEDEVVELMRGDGGDPPPLDAGSEVVGEEVLAETLQPERAFEKVDSNDDFQSIESMGEEFQEAEPVLLEDESELEELSAEDLLEEEAPEEAILEPAGFDQSLEEKEAGQGEAHPAQPDMEEIEVELPDSALDVESMNQEKALEEGMLDNAEPFQPESDAEPPQPPSSEEVKESIPLSVRHMMDLKPVFSREAGTQTDSTSLVPDDGEVEALQSELDDMDKIALGEEEIDDQEIEFLDQSELEEVDEGLMDEPAQSVETAGDELAGDDIEVIDLDAEELEASEIGEELADEVEMRPVEPEIPATLDESETAEAIIAEDSVPEAVLEEETAVAAEPVEKEDEDFFREEYLGEEEIDEDQIISAEEPEAFPELSDEDEKELNFLVSEEEQELSQLDSLEDEQFVADAEDEIIDLDQEEEDIIRTSLEEDRSSGSDAEMSLEPDVSDDPLFERNFNALDEEQGAFTSDGLESAPLGDTGPADDVSEPGAQSITLEGPLGAESEEDDGKNAADEEKIWEPETPPGFIAKPNEEFPPDAIQEPFTGRQEEGGENSPTPRFTPEEVLEDPDTMEPVLTPEDMEAGAAAYQKKVGLKAADAAEPEVEELVMGGEKEVPELLLDDDLVDQPATFEEDAGLMGADELPLNTEPEPENDELVIGGETDVPDLAVSEEMDADPTGGDDLVSVLGADEHPDASDFIATEETSDAASDEPEKTPPESFSDGLDLNADEDGETDTEFDSLFSSMQDDIAANPDGENLNDVLRIDGIRERVANLHFSLPQNESPFSRAMGIYAQAGISSDSAYPSAMWGPEGGSTQPAMVDKAMAMEGSGVQTGAGLEGISLLDSDIRNKLGAVLDEIISVSVRKAVQEEMPKLMERMSKEA